MTSALTFADFIVSTNERLLLFMPYPIKTLQAKAVFFCMRNLWRKRPNNSERNTGQC